VSENVPTRVAHPDVDAVTYPVSYAQESLLDGVYESAITVPAVARVGAGLPPAQLQRALDVLVTRPAAVRSVFGRSDGGAVVQRVRPAGALPPTVAEHQTRPRDAAAGLATSLFFSAGSRCPPSSRAADCGRRGRAATAAAGADGKGRWVARRRGRLVPPPFRGHRRRTLLRPRRATCRGTPSA
jgi:hypothetical protein